MIKDASRNARLLVGVLAAFGMVAAMAGVVMVAGPHAGSETGAIMQLGWVVVFIGAALLARWREHGGFAEFMTLLALEGPTHIAGDLWSDRFDPHRASDGSVYLDWDPAIAPTAAVLVVLAIVLGCIVGFGVHMPSRPKVYVPVPGWPPDASALGKTNA